MPYAVLSDAECGGHEIAETLAFHTDDAGSRFATVVLANGDVQDVDLIDVTAHR